ncbi:MAG: hypothetical protein JXA68_06365 [Ignavibacteriales bacterium]|nr:hypothetical protein [Ignavibacteriales bacterium]
MIWRLINSGENSGPHNMDFDVQLTKDCREDEAYFRLYRWKPYCISLGYHQDYSDINKERSQQDNIDIVKRPTGGRAILHAEEITYSCIIPNKFGLSARQIYEKISMSLITGLEIYNPQLSQLELEKIQPDFPDLLKTDKGLLCFSTAAKNEVKFKGKKLIGSAQRRTGDFILQHGSILCGNYHKKIVNYVNLSENIINELRNELDNKTTDIEEILGIKVDYEKLSKNIIEGFEKYWEIKFVENGNTQ